MTMPHAGRLAFLVVLPLLGQSPANLGLTQAQIDQALAERRPQPLVLHEISDPRYSNFDREHRDGVRLRRGVILTPYLRVALYGARPGSRPDPEVIKRLASPELWVVVFPYSPERARAVMGQTSPWRLDPEKRLDGFGITGGVVFVPEKLAVEVRKPRRKVEPLWVETRDFELGYWFQEEWVRGRSLAAAYAMDDPAIVERTGRIWVEGVDEKEGREQFQAWGFPLDRISEADWNRALGR